MTLDEALKQARRILIANAGIGWAAQILRPIESAILGDTLATVDRHGVELYAYDIDYLTPDNHRWSARFYAHNEADAAARLEAIRTTDFAPEQVVQSWAEGREDS